MVVHLPNLVGNVSNYDLKCSFARRDVSTEFRLTKSLKSAKSIEKPKRVELHTLSKVRGEESDGGKTFQSCWKCLKWFFEVDIYRARRLKKMWLSELPEIGQFN